MPDRNVGQLFSPTDQTYAGASLKATYRHRVRVAYGVSTTLSLRFRYHNWKQCPDSIAGLNTIIVAAAVEIGAVVTPLTFSGSAEVSIPVGTSVLSDPITVTTSDFVYVRSRPRVTAGTWPTGFIYGGATYGNEGFTDNADLTLTGSGAVGVATGYGYGPFDVMVSNNVYASVFVEGDSIVVGQSDNGTGGGFTPEALFATGWLRRVLTGWRPEKCNAKSGTTLASRNPTTLTSTLYGDCTYFINELGVNDLGASSVATIKANMIYLWTAAKAAGCRTAQTTITPDSNITHEATRVAVNTWLRAGVGLTNLDTVLDISAIVETSLNSGVIKPTYSDDGLHYNDAGSAAIAAAISAQLKADVMLADNTLSAGTITAVGGPGVVTIGQTVAPSGGTGPYVNYLGYSAPGAGVFTRVLMFSPTGLVLVPTGTWDIVRITTDPTNPTIGVQSNVVSSVVVGNPALFVVWPMSSDCPS